MPPDYGYLINQGCMYSHSIGVKESLWTMINTWTFIFQLMLEHNYSIAIRRSDNDIVCFKELCSTTLYPKGSGIFLKMIIIPVLH
jgi:hypothetical protein